MADKKIMFYFEEGLKRGYDINVLKKKLVESNFPIMEIENAISYINKKERARDGEFRNNFLEGLRVHTPVFLRISMGLMYLWFGINQLISPELFFGFIPYYARSFPFSPLATVYLNGTFEVLFSSILLLGIFVRFSALALSVHLYFIGFSLGYNGIMIRDIALATAIFVVFLNGDDKFCLSRILERRRS